MWRPVGTAEEVRSEPGNTRDDSERGASPTAFTLMGNREKSFQAATRQGRGTFAASRSRVYGS